MPFLSPTSPFRSCVIPLNWHSQSLTTHDEVDSDGKRSKDISFIMSIHENDDDDDNEGFPSEEEEEEDDDDDDDDDFAGLEEEGDEDEEHDDPRVFILDGKLFIKDQHLHFQGPTFHFVSKESPSWNFLDDNSTAIASSTASSTITSTTNKNTSTQDIMTLHMMGPCDVMSTSSHSKPTPRQMLLRVEKQQPVGKSEDGEGPAFYYQVQAEQIDVQADGGDRLEFQGKLYPGSDNLVCQARLVQPSAVATMAAAAAPTKEDEDDALEDEDLDVNELIALHEDAGMSVDDLRKRYRQSSGTEDINGDQGKRAKMAPPQDDDEDDDDYGF